MTAHSLAVVPSNHQGGSRPTHRSLENFRIPPAIAKALPQLRYSRFEYQDEMRALARAKHDGFIEAIPTLANRDAAALAPVQEKLLLDRLTMLGMSMAHG